VNTTPFAARLRRTVLAIIACASALASNGCEMFGMAAAALVPPKQDAVYEIDNRPTAVIVDDPGNTLRDPQLAMLIAESCAHVLKENEVITQIIDVKSVAALASELGDKFVKTSPYEIGRRLGAKQVINVNVFSASVSPEPGLLKPSMEVGVKVFDVDGRQRLFPPAASATGVPESAANDGFYIHRVSMRYRVTDADPARVMAIAQQKIAEETGSSVARLFFTHDPTKFDDIRQ